MTTAVTRRRRARAGGLALSLGLHAAVLAVLGWIAAPRFPPGRSAALPPDLQVRLVTSTGAAGGPSPRRARTGPSSGDLVGSATPEAAPEASPAVALPRTPAPTAPNPAPPAAPAGAQAGAAAATGGGDAGAEGGGDLRGLLRASLGCDHRDAAGLTAAERARCDARAGGLARAAPRVDPIAPAKRAYYDAVAAAYAEMRYPTPTVRPFAHGAGAAGAYDDPPSAIPGRLPAFGCKVPLGVPKGWKPPTGGTLAHSLKLGPLPCYIVPPKGPLDPEVDLPDPDDFKPR